MKVEYSTNINETAPVEIGIEFGLIQHDNVITEDKECGSTCAQVAGFSTGVDYNTVPPSCIACNSSLQLEFSPANGTCSCQDHFVQRNGVCANCDIDLCGYCNSARTECFQCVDNAVFKNDTSRNQGCICVDGYYRDDIECKKCSPGCVTCGPGDECNTCVDSDDTRETAADGNCACKVGFFEAGSNICGKCNAECLTCEGTASNCVTCNLTGNFNQTGSTCVCNDGFSLVLAADSSASCVPCVDTC